MSQAGSKPIGAASMDVVVVGGGAAGVEIGKRDFLGAGPGIEPA